MSAVAWSAPAMAQQRHVVDPSLMRQAIADQGAKDQQNRDALLGAMRRPEVRDMAGQLGLSVMRAEDAVATLDSAELAGLAAPVSATELAGGSNTIVISTTTLLLVIIIVILIAR